jgi:hypothetical protein
MSATYAEMLNGAPLARRAPGARHELICGRLHKWMKASVANFAGTRLLAPRSEVRLSLRHTVCPDLALVATATGKVNVRIIDGSAVAGSNGIDVYIYQTGLGPPPTPQVSGLALGRSSAYLPMTFESSYAFEVFSHGNGSPQFTFFETFVAGEIMTLVIVDTPNGQAMSDIPIVLTDLE